MVGVARRQLHDAENFPNDYPQNPNSRASRIASTWSFKATRQLRRAVGHPHFAGAAPPVGRQLRAHDDRRAGGAGDRRQRRRGATAYAEPADANREDNIAVFDIRAREELQVQPRASGSAAYLDLFNMTNSHASETITRATGLQLPEADRDPGAVHGAGRVPVHLLSGAPVGGVWRERCLAVAPSTPVRRRIRFPARCGVPAAAPGSSLRDVPLPRSALILAIQPAMTVLFTGYFQLHLGFAAVRMLHSRRPLRRSNLCFGLCCSGPGPRGRPPHDRRRA